MTFPYTYYVYGITLQSEIPLCLPQVGCGELAEIELREASASFFSEAIRETTVSQADGSWYHVGRLLDGSSYLRWEGVGEFLISGDGRRMFGRQLDAAGSESFQVYMLGQALSYALVGRGFEPIHATVVVVDGEGIAFLGNSGFGKSTLADSFISAGHHILTDDLLILESGCSRIFGHPGPPRIKLFPDTARRFLGNAVNGLPMNRYTEKLILPLDSRQICSSPAPVKAVFGLTSPREVFRKQAFRIEPLSSRDALLEIVRNTFNRRITNASRLQRQFAEASRLVRLLPVDKLAIPRSFANLPSVREAIIKCASVERLGISEPSIGFGSGELSPLGVSQ